MRILLLWKAFEIYVKNGKSYLFNFLNTNEYENFMKDFLTKSKLKHLIRKRDFLTEKSNIYKDWKAGLISNQDYLLLLNRYSSRSFNDPTQYPVFPSFRSTPHFLGQSIHRSYNLSRSTLFSKAKTRLFAAGGMLSLSLIIIYCFCYDYIGAQIRYQHSLKSMI